MEETSKCIDGEVLQECWKSVAERKRELFAEQPWLFKASPGKKMGVEILKVNLPQKRVGKQALKDMMDMRRWFDAVPTAWWPCIRRISPSSLRILPRRGNECPDSSHVGDACVGFAKFIKATTERVTGYMCNMRQRNGRNGDTQIPALATVALSCGATVGGTVVAAWRIQIKAGLADRTRAIHGVWFGLELFGLQKCHCCDELFLRRMSVCYSPATGECMLRQPDDPSRLVASNVSPPAKEVSESIEIHMTMSESFAMQFIQIDKAKDSIVRSGKIMFPCCNCWIENVFPAVTVRTADVSCEMEISTIPRHPMLFEEKLAQPISTFDGEWCWHD